MNRKKDDNKDLSSLYSKELIENLKNAYKNMEGIGLISKRTLNKYNKILKSFEKGK